MNVTKKIRKRFDFLTVFYGFLCDDNSSETICFYNDKTAIHFEYDSYRHEYLDLLITKNNVVIVKVNYGSVFWSDNTLTDEKLSQRLEDVFALRQQFITLSEKKLDDLVEIYANYIEDNIYKLLDK